MSALIIAIFVFFVSAICMYLILRRRGRLPTDIRLTDLLSFLLGTISVVIFAHQIGEHADYARDLSDRNNIIQSGLSIQARIRDLEMGSCKGTNYVHSPSSGQLSNGSFESVDTKDGKATVPYSINDDCSAFSYWEGRGANVATMPKFGFLILHIQSPNRRFSEDRNNEIATYNQSADDYRNADRQRDLRKSRDIWETLIQRIIASVVLAIAAGFGAARRYVDWEIVRTQFEEAKVKRFKDQNANDKV